MRPSGTGKIAGLQEILAFAASYGTSTGGQATKKNFAEGFSRAAATWLASALRPHFGGITPDEEGRRQETPAPTAKGYKRLDVGYSTPELGLALGISLKSIHSKDKASGYRKNFSRNENELRAEATDYHQRQPFAVLVGVLFLPVDACEETTKGKGRDPLHSSFASAVRFFRDRSRRRLPSDPLDAFEAFFIGLYDRAADRVDFFDVEAAPPKLRRPRSEECLTLQQLVERIRSIYDARNVIPFSWKD